MDIIKAIHADLVAIRRAYMKGGNRLACAEILRRWPAITDATAPIMLDRILAVPITRPEPAGRNEPRSEGPRSTRRQW